MSRRPKYVHSTNSAAGLWQNQEVQDIERIGLAMYGLNPSGDELALPYELEPALSLHSELTHVKKIHKGDTVGYGATFRAEEDTYVGTVSIGYADGWTRDMQGFKVIVDGQYCEIIGRISMDQMTIRLPKNYEMGTQVTLIGKMVIKRLLFKILPTGVIRLATKLSVFYQIEFTVSMKNKSCFCAAFFITFSFKNKS